MSDPGHRGPTAHRLAVDEISPLTERSFLISFAVPGELHEAYRFTAGQHIMINTRVGETVERRAYSICTSPQHLEATGRFAVGVKIIPGGRFSERVRHRLVVGDRLKLSTPTGRFVAREPDTPGRRYAMIAAGSGVTPMMSIITDLLARDVDARIALTLQNRTRADIMFAHRLAELAEHHPGLTVRHHLSAEQHPGAGFGRLEGPALAAELDHLLDEHPDEWFLCGPQSLVASARGLLADAGVSKRLVHHELFWTG